MYEKERVIENEKLLDLTPTGADRLLMKTIQDLRDEVIELVKADDKAIKDYIFTVHRNYDPIRLVHVIKVDAKHKKELV